MRQPDPANLRGGDLGVMAFLEQVSAVFRASPKYRTESNDLAELPEVVPARFDRLIFCDGEAPDGGHITQPQLLADNLAEGRLTFNFFASVHARS